MGAFVKFMASNRSRWGADRVGAQGEKEGRESGLRARQGKGTIQALTEEYSERAAWSLIGIGWVVGWG